MVASNWINQASGNYLEDANKYKDLLGDEYTSNRKNLVNTLYSMGLRTGGVSKGMGELGRTYNQNLAGVNRDISSNKQSAQEANATLTLLNDIQNLTTQYQEALKNATQLRRGAEQQMFDTGAGSKATEYENTAKALRAQIQAKYGQLQGMSTLNPYTGQIAQQAPGMASQFSTAAMEGESNISSGSAIGIGKPLALLASMLIPGAQGLTPALMASTVGGALKGDMNLGVTDALSAVTQVPGMLSNVPGAVGEGASALDKAIGKMASSYKDYFGGNLQSDLARYSMVGATPQQIVADLLTKQADLQMQKRMEEQGYTPGDMTTTTKDAAGNTTVQKYIKDYGIQSMSAAEAAKNYTNIKAVTKGETVDIEDPYTVPIKIDGKARTFMGTARQPEEKTTMANRKSMFDLQAQYSTVKYAPGKGLTQVAAYTVDPATGNNIPKIAYVDLKSKIRTPGDLRAEASFANTEFYRGIKAELGRGKMDASLPDFASALENITARADVEKWSKKKFSIALSAAVDVFDVTDDKTLAALTKLLGKK
jgi:hypothetical protein